jgi:hypothetical protein
MKKHLFLVALAGVALAGCVKNEVETPATEGVKIGFSAPVLYSNVDTKASVYGEIGSHKYEGTGTVYTYPREEKFQIFAVEHTGNLTTWDAAEPTDFNATAISYNKSLDAWAPLKDDDGFYYWPDNKQLSFAAMSPAELDVTGATTSYSSTGLVIGNFTVADEPSKQYDLLYSDRSINKTAADMKDYGASYYGGIPIMFKHALSSIHFSLKTDATETVTLLSIQLKNAKNKGTFKENITNEAALTRNPEWSIADDAELKSYTSFTGSVEFPLNPQYVSALAALDGTDDNDKSHPLLLLPQALGNDVVVEVKYEVGGEEKTRTVQLNQYPASEPITAWEVGTKYTYRLVYSREAQRNDIIYFSPETDVWQDGGIVEVIL